MLCSGPTIYRLQLSLLWFPGPRAEPLQSPPAGCQRTYPVLPFHGKRAHEHPEKHRVQILQMCNPKLWQSKGMEIPWASTKSFKLKVHMLLKQAFNTLSESRNECQLVRDMLATMKFRTLMSFKSNGSRQYLMSEYLPYNHPSYTTARIIYKTSFCMPCSLALSSHAPMERDAFVVSSLFPSMMWQLLWTVLLTVCHLYKQPHIL